MSKYYLAIDEPEEYYLFTSLHLAVRFIQEEDLDNFVLTDQPFLDENDKEIPTKKYRFIG